jgi:hypothetical protein
LSLVSISSALMVRLSPRCVTLPRIRDDGDRANRTNPDALSVPVSVCRECAGRVGELVAPGAFEGDSADLIIQVPQTEGASSLDFFRGKF